MVALLFHTNYTRELIVYYLRIMADENLNKLVEDIERITTESNSTVPLWDNVLINCFNGLIDELKGVNKIM